jgi:hypothetical protein
VAPGPGRVLIAALLAAAIALVAMKAESWAGPIPAGPCFWIHGRLFAANGAPTFRISWAGAKRILGVKAAEGADAAINDLPD